GRQFVLSDVVSDVVCANAPSTHCFGTVIASSFLSLPPVGREGTWSGPGGWVTEWTGRIGNRSRCRPGGPADALERDLCHDGTLAIHRSVRRRQCNDGCAVPGVWDQPQDGIPDAGALCSRGRRRLAGPLACGASSSA